MEPDQELSSEELALKSRFFIRRLSGLGATFDHLSYTCYSGFEVTKMPALKMLRQCKATDHCQWPPIFMDNVGVKVKSLRLTMQSGVAIQDPELPRPLLPMIERLQLVGDMKVTTQRLSLLFPSLEHFEVDKQDLITGKRLEKRARVLSNYAPEFVDQDANLGGIAAAC